MTSSVTPSWLQRTWNALGRALKRGLLGKSSHDYMKQFTGSDSAPARPNWPQDHPVTPHPEPRYEPVHGWTTRQSDEYLARNPAYRPIYEAELARRSR